MQKILTTRQIKMLDAYTIEHEPVASIDLMERACRAFVEWFIQKFDTDRTIWVVCGTGNNGGDGLGIARLLKHWNYHVSVFIIQGGQPSNDFSINLERLKKTEVPISNVTSINDINDVKNSTIVIDAIFGSGLSRPPEGLYAEVISAINSFKATVVAVDIPSGLMADVHSQNNESIIKADFTVTFQLPKLAFMLPQSHAFTGEWHVVRIGLHKDFIRKAETPYHVIEKKFVKKITKERSKFSHKGNFGKILIISGSKGKIGAAVLSSRAALRSGVGLLTVHVPGIGNPILQTAVPEAMVSTGDHEEVFSMLPPVEHYDAVGVGPGLGQRKETVKAFGELLRSFTKPMVIDADALNILSSKGELLPLVTPGSILTPHPKEFERLVGEWKNDFERLEKLKAFSKQLDVIVVLKGAHTSIATPDGLVFFNTTGNAGMATGGTGDVLTGILTGLLGQGYLPVETAILGVYLHGLAGDLAKVEKGEEGLIASDLIDFLPKAFKAIAG